MPADASYQLKSEWRNCFGPDVRDGFFDGISRENQACIGRADRPQSGHLADEIDQFAQ